jgi:hypothetical protein
MNPHFLGDSYDLVKRVFLNEISALGYRMVIDPMFTGAWTDEAKEQYFSLVRPSPGGTRRMVQTKSMLFLDPDTGVKKTGGKRHVSFGLLAKAASQHALVVCFDQSFSFSGQAQVLMRSKLDSLVELGCHGMYYDSHARFLFVAKNSGALRRVSKRLMSLGIPPDRFIIRAT